MFRRCSGSFTKQLRTSKINPWQRTSTSAKLCRNYASVVDVPAGTSPTVSSSSDFYEAAAPNHPDTPTKLVHDIRSPERYTQQVQSSAFVPAPVFFFTRLLQLLENEDVSGTTLCHFVRKSYRPPVAGMNYVFTDFQQSLLSQVLHRVLDEWAIEGFTVASVQPIQVLRFYVAQKFMRDLDWVYCLSFLAKTAYQSINLHKQESPGSALDKEIYDAIRLRTLCNFWSVFLIGREPEKSDVRSWARDEPLWPELRNRPAEPSDVRDNTDYVQCFKSFIAKNHSISSPELDHQLAYTSILTLVVFYHSLRTFFVDNNDTAGGDEDTLFESGSSTTEERVLSRSQPNWHLGPSQCNYWAPEIGYLSVSEASILYVIARAAKDTNVNYTLLRITLAQMSLAESDTQEIARIYQGFRLAVPAIIARFQGFVYDEHVNRVGILRQYPLRAYVERAAKSNDLRAIEHAESVVDSCGGARNIVTGDVQALIRAFLEMGYPNRALRYWNLLAQASKFSQQDWAWQIWLDHAFENKDHIAFETAWKKLGIHGIRRTLSRWHQRLLLLHHTNQPVAAFDHFCTLVRFSGKNRTLKGSHLPEIAPRTLELATFHLMIRAYLETTTIQGIAMDRAKQTLELLKRQEGLQPTSVTYMLFIRHFLKRDARQAAVDWFGDGRQQGIKFLPQDYALVFEFDLTRHQEDGRRPLADSSAAIGDCLAAIDRMMRFIGGFRLFSLASTQRPHWSSKLENTPNGMFLVDRVAHDIGDPKLRELQALYTGIMQHLSLNFADRPSDGAKTARLRLLLLLWDHCVESAIPASTEMESALRSVIYSLHPELQEKLLRGAMFKNYNSEDHVAFHSYRYLRRIGSEWFAERLGSIVSGPTKSQLAKMPWNGYTALNDKVLINAGITSQDDRIKVLEQIRTWRESAVSKRTEAAEKKKKRRKELEEREGQYGQGEGYEDMLENLNLTEQRQARKIEVKQQLLDMLLQKSEKMQADKRMERRLVFEQLGLPESSDSEICSGTLLQARIRGQRSLPRSRAVRSDYRATRRQSIRDAADKLRNARA